jgi:hypothetical protein
MPMAEQVVNGAQLQCSFGTAPSALVVLPANKVNCGNVPAANIMDHVPMTNIMSFGMCQSISNPEVATATTAAQGVLTPQACVPATSSPWAPGAAKTKVGNQPALDKDSKCNCQWLGVIQITSPGQVTTKIS